MFSAGTGVSQIWRSPRALRPPVYTLLYIIYFLLFYFNSFSPQLSVSRWCVQCFLSFQTGRGGARPSPEGSSTFDEPSDSCLLLSVPGIIRKEARNAAEISWHKTALRERFRIVLSNFRERRASSNRKLLGQISIDWIYWAGIYFFNSILWIVSFRNW